MPTSRTSCILHSRRVFTEGISATALELVSGQNVRLPGEFFINTDDTAINNSDFLSRLRTQIRSLQPSSTSFSSRSFVALTFWEQGYYRNYDLHLGTRGC